MKKNKIVILGILLFITLISAKNKVQIRMYEMGDWITYKNCNYITSLCEGRDYVYFGTSGGILPYHRFQEFAEPPYTISDGMSNDDINCVIYNHTTSSIWTGHKEGVSYLHPAAVKWENCLNEEIVQIGTGTGYIWAISVDGTVYKLENLSGMIISTMTFNEIPKDITWSITQDNSEDNFNDYFITGDYSFHNDGKIIDNELREYQINIFYKDSSHDIFGGINGLGFITGDDNIKRININHYGIMQNFVNAIEFSENSLWIAGEQPDYPLPFNSTEKTGISCYNFDEEKWHYLEDRFIPELATNRILDLKWKNGKLWVGTMQGLSIYKQKENTWKRLSVTKGLKSEIIQTIALEDSIAWIGTSLGLNMVSIPELNVEQIYFTKNRMHININKIEIGHENVWVGTNNGIYSINRKNHKILHYDMNGDECDLNDAVASECLAITSNDSLTIFKTTKNLLQFDNKNGKWSNLPDYHNFYIYDIALDGDYLWLGTPEGAILLNIDDASEEHYTMSDGLCGNNVFKIIPDGDWVWFGTENGLTKYQWRKYAK